MSLYQEKRILRSTFYQSVFMFKGDPLSYHAFPFWIQPLNSARLSDKFDQAYRALVYKCSRQVAKTSNIGIQGYGISLEKRNFVSIIVQPTDEQISRFSTQVLKKIDSESIITDVIFKDSTVEKRVKNKSFSNGSRIVLGNIHHSVMSTRGIPGDAAFFDEYQDIPVENALVVEGALSRSPHKYRIYSGTPLTDENDLQVKFDQSTGHEWGVKCPGCGYWNINLGLKNIGNKGIICSHCGKILNPRFGLWIPARLSRANGEPMMYEGYHMNELMLPTDTVYHTSIKQIHVKLETQPEHIIYNELLGESFSKGERPFTDKDIMACCNPNRSYIKDIAEAQKIVHGKYSFFVAGLDWATETRPKGSQTDQIKSYTMLAIAGYNATSSRLEVVMIKRFYDSVSWINDDPEYVADEVVRWLTAFDVKIICLDYGAGHKENNIIKKRYTRGLPLDPYGQPIPIDRYAEYQIRNKRVMEVKYPSSDIIYDPDANRFAIPRTETLDDMVWAFKREGMFEFAKWDGQTSEFATDLTTLFIWHDGGSERRHYGKTKADDLAHVLNFMLLAFKAYTGTLEYIEKKPTITDYN